MPGLLSAIASASIFAIMSHIFYRHFTRISVSNVPGPESESFIFGHLRESFDGEASEAEFRWQAEYGGIVRVKAAFGEDRLLISDPKALRHICQTSGYNYPKIPERRIFTRIFTGKSISWADGDTHKRHKKVLLPGFGGVEMKAFVPLFNAHASKLTTMWRDLIFASEDQSVVLNISTWASRVGLDTIGEAAFDYHFGAMDSTDNELKDVYSNVIADTFGSPSNKDLFIQSVLPYIPMRMGELLTDHMPSKKLRRVRLMNQVAISVAKSLVKSKTEALLQGTDKRDIMTLLVNANISEKENTRLNEEEILSEMRNILLAGHETTAITLSWILLELARHSEIQQKLRQEIRVSEKSVRARGALEFTSVDFDDMPYLVGVLKVLIIADQMKYDC